MRHLLVLPDGTQIFSGQIGKAAVRDISLTHCVNAQTGLIPGSVCAAMLEATIIVPDDSFRILPGQALTLYQLDEEGTQSLVGIFIAEKPARLSLHTYRVTAYDRVSLLDKDMTTWLSSLDAWPYSLYDFASLVCSACGLELENSELPNGALAVQRFSVDGITARQLLQWVGEVAGRFCRATPAGGLEFAWYVQTSHHIGASAASAAVLSAAQQPCISDLYASVSYDKNGNVCLQSQGLCITDDGQGHVTLAPRADGAGICYFSNGTHFEDYETAPVEKVQLRQNEQDIGTVYPAVETPANTLVISANALLSAANADTLMPVAQSLYEQMRKVCYTPCRISIAAGTGIRAGDIITVTDAAGRSMCVYVMVKTQAGQTETLECTGNPSLDTTTAVHERAFRALSGKVLNLRTDVDGMIVKNAEADSAAASLKLTVDQINSEVLRQEQLLGAVRKDLSNIDQTAENVRVRVESIEQNGVSQVVTGTGYTFSADGLRIGKSGTSASLTNKLTQEGMFVIRDEGKSTQTVMLEADQEQVNAENITVRKYLLVGGHARFESFGDGRTACFWI